jgi:hypothetical protein
LGPEVNFAYSSHKAVEEYKEAKAVCIFFVFVFAYVERKFSLLA